MRKHIYADNAATTKLDPEAFEAMKPWLLDEYGNPSQPYSFSRRAKEALIQARLAIAECINASPDEIYFTSGGTESNNWTIKGIALNNWNHKAMITSSFEHHAILNACKAIEKHGYPVLYIKPNNHGTVMPETLQSYITNDTILVSVMFANNELGTIQPIQELCEIAHSHNAIFHTDAVQAVGHVKIDVNKINVDMLSASAHKFNGPKGIGFLYLRNGVKLAPYLDGGSQENHMRAGTENVASIVGMAVALKNNTKALESNQTYINSLEQLLLRRMDDNNITYIRNGDNFLLPGIISISFEGTDGETILHRMDLMGITISTGAACNGKSTQISHVLKAIDMPESLAKGTIRISLSHNNTEIDIESIVSALKKIIPV